jgi:hypothetical protein
MLILSCLVQVIQTSFMGKLLLKALFNQKSHWIYISSFAWHLVAGTLPLPLIWHLSVHCLPCQWGLHVEGNGCLWQCWLRPTQTDYSQREHQRKISHSRHPHYWRPPISPDKLSAASRTINYCQNLAFGNRGQGGQLSVARPPWKLAAILGRCLFCLRGCNSFIIFFY